MNREQERAMFSKKYNHILSKREKESSKINLTGVSNKKLAELEQKRLTNLKNVKYDESVKICDRCGKYFNTENGGNHATGMSGLLCSACDARGLKGGTYPAHWAWNKLNSKKHVELFGRDAKWEDLPRNFKEKFAKENGISYVVD